MRRFALVLLVALSTPLLMGASDSVFPSIRTRTMTQADRDQLDAISAYLNSIVTLKGGFVQIAPSGEMSEGTFYLSKPGKLRFEYQPPVPTLLVADGHDVAVVNRQLKTVDSYPLFETPLSTILAKRVDLRHSPQFVSMTRQEGSIVINLRSNQAHSKANITLVFAAPVYELRQWTVLDNQGLATTVALRDLQPGAAMADSLFVLPNKNMFGPKR